MNHDSLTTYGFEDKIRKSANSVDMDVLAEKVRTGARSVGLKSKEISTQAVSYVRTHPGYTALAVAGVTIAIVAFVYRNRIQRLF